MRVGTNPSPGMRCFQTQRIARVSRKEPKIKRPTHRFLSSTGRVFGRSFFPLFALTIIVGVIFWGPWISLAFTVVAIAAALRLI